MTTSHTTYRGQGFWADDTTIELWLHLLVHTTPTSPQPAWTTSARDHWAVQASVGFLGCVNVGLDEHLAGDPTRETEFLALANDFDTYLAELGPTIPAATATAYHIGGHTEFFADVDVRTLHWFSRQLINLVTTPTAPPSSEHC